MEAVAGLLIPKGFKPVGLDGGDTTVLVTGERAEGMGLRRIPGDAVFSLFRFSFARRRAEAGEPGIGARRLLLIVDACTRG